MNLRITVQHAVACLQAIDAEQTKQTPSTLSRTVGIPPQLCRRILLQLAYAGIVVVDTFDQVRLSKSLSEIKALELIEAVTRTLPASGMKPLVRSSREVLRYTRSLVAKGAETYGNDGGVLVEDAAPQPFQNRWLWENN